MTDMTTVTNPNYVPGHSVAMRTHDGETLAVMPRTYEDGRGRYYMAFSLTDGWVELDPAFVTGHTKPTLTFPTALKRAVDRLLGHDLHVAPRVYG